MPKPKRSKQIIPKSKVTEAERNRAFELRVLSPGEKYSDQRQERI